MNMKKKYLVMLVLVILIGGIMAIGINYYFNQYYAQRLINAIDNNDEKKVEELLKAYGNVNSSNVKSRIYAAVAEMYYYTPLQEACQKGNIHIVKMLLNNGADVNYVQGHIAPYSPLIMAISSGEDSNLEIVKLLIEKGADVNYSINNKADAIKTIVESNYEIAHSMEILKSLQAAGAEIHREYPSGNLLNIACYWKKTEIIQYLIKSKQFDVNAISSIGRTPLLDLCTSTKKGKIEDLKFLLDNGANKTIKDSDGKTAYDYAIEYGNVEFAELLKN